VLKKKHYVFALLFVLQPLCLSQNNEKQDINQAIDIVKKIQQTFFVQGKKRITLRQLLRKIPAFERIPLPSLASKLLDGVEFFAPELKVLEESGVELIFKETRLFGQKKTITTRLYVGPDAKGDLSGMTYSVGFPGTFSLLDIIPEMKERLKTLTLGILHKKFADQLDKAGLTIDKFIGLAEWIQFENVGIVLCPSISFNDPVWGNVYEGINVLASVKLSGPLEKLSNLIGQDLTTLRFKGRIMPNESLIGSFLSITYPGTITLLKIPNFLEIRAGQRSWSVGIAELASGVPGPRVGGSFGMKVKLPGQEEFIDFSGYAILFLDKAIIGGKATGMVENFFGIPGLDIGNLGLQVVINYLAAAETAGLLSVTGGAMTGELHLGKLKIKLTEALSYTLPNPIPTVVFEGVLPEKITHKDLIGMAVHFASSAARITKKKVDTDLLTKAFLKIIPPFNIGDFKVYLALKTGLLFGRLFRKGLHLKGAVEFAGIGGELELQAIFGGLKGKAYFKQIKIPKKDPIRIISGAGQDQKRGTDDDCPIASLELSLKKQEFYVDGIVEIPFLGFKRSEQVKLTPFGGIHIDIETMLAGVATQLIINGDPKSFESFYVKGSLQQEGLNKLRMLLTQQINQFAQKVQRDLRAAQSGVEKWRFKVRQDINAWVQKKVEKTQKNIDRLHEKIKQGKLKCKLGKKIACLAVPKWKIDKVALELKKKVALEKVIKKIVHLGTGLISDVSRAGLKGAKKTVERARRVNVFVGNLIQGVFNIEKVTFSGTLKELVTKGVGVKVRVIGTILGRKINQEFQADLKKPNQLPKQIISFARTILGV